MSNSNKKVLKSINKADAMALTAYKLTDQDLLSQSEGFLASLTPDTFSNVSTTTLVTKLQMTAAENVSLKWKIEKIIAQLGALISTIPTRITIWWLIGNTKTIINFVKAVIDILKGNEPEPQMAIYPR